MSQLATMSDAAVINSLAAISDGSRIVIKTIHVRDTSRVRVLRGTVAKKNDYWILMCTTTTRYRIPNEDLLFISIELVEAVADADAAAAASADAATTINVEDIEDQNTGSQQAPPQPSAEASLLAVALRAIEGFSRLLPTVQQAAVQQTQPSQATPAVTEVQQRQDDVSRLMLMSDAFRGQDNPTWRLAPGLLLHRFVPEKFLIRSQER